MMEREWLVLALLLVMANAMSRRHRDATPYIDDDSHQLWTEDASGGPLDGEDVSTHLLQESEPCQSHFCERGRVCRLDWQGEPTCECQPFCSRHRKLVCGTDGLLYLNHCELHRAACVTGMAIHIDRTRKCFRKGLQPITWDNNAPTSATPAPDLSDPALKQLTPIVRDDLTQHETEFRTSVTLAIMRAVQAVNRWVSGNTGNIWRHSPGYTLHGFIYYVKGEDPKVLTQRLIRFVM
ncbi:WAP, Kazal, immunoglobulin, Kunitz and NTR domain-containing protein-like [Penaeus japonicus]|uniref:WAP, Kazal, immunoglobulin, Kunitz and NTR domain-containing protein-like n=1 Tax=Penaeus japonicus TaxID=27405 RepID=UPI001C712E51|nr:WAP, Kazal, immunoglobulin, Kunitz and NTR domain-containing protein-like [Penaeus japonicus]